jgi:ssRNA-specific RNase YbeY (16S rRNA maturation enzyme)
MEIPNKVKIGDIWYDVILVAKDLIYEDAVVIGKITFSQALIELDSRRSKQNIDRTFLHEIVHGILCDRGVDVTQENDEEEVVEQLSKGLHQVMLDNPKIFTEQIQFLD